MSLEEKLLNDFKEALKNKETTRVSVLSFLRAQISYAALEKKKNNLEDNECLVVIKKLIKQHQDSIDQFKLGNRIDLVNKEVKELEILKSYLPAEMSGEALKKIVTDVIQELSASGMKDMGRVMKEVMARAQGAADAKSASDLVKEILSKAQTEKEV